MPFDKDKRLYYQTHTQSHSPSDAINKGVRANAWYLLVKIATCLGRPEKTSPPIRSFDHKSDRIFKSLSFIGMRLTKTTAQSYGAFNLCR
ncbi:hypothetical protein CS542_08505 [Pedobacter sp. IW39]|nr:hypothetical protein CS542_08505 [Pedobacter sp. IW39]